MPFQTASISRSIQSYCLREKLISFASATKSWRSIQKWFKIWLQFWNRRMGHQKKLSRGSSLLCITLKFFRSITCLRTCSLRTQRNSLICSRTLLLMKMWRSKWHLLRPSLHSYPQLMRKKLFWSTRPWLTNCSMLSLRSWNKTRDRVSSRSNSWLSWRRLIPISGLTL